MTILFCRAYYRFLSHGKYSWLVDAWLKKHLRNVGGAATVLFLQLFIPNLYWNFKLGIFRFTACAGTFFCSERFVYKKQTSSISHESQRETQTLLEHCLQQYLRTRMAQKFAFIVLFTLAIFGGFARAAPCSRFPRTARQAPSIPASCETQLLPAQLQALKQQVRSKLVSIRDEMEEVVNGTLKGTTVSVARRTANFFHCQVATALHSRTIFPFMQGPASRIGMYAGNFSTVDANRQNVSHLLQKISGGVHTSS